MKGEVILEADIVLWFQFKFCLRIETDNIHKNASDLMPMTCIMRHARTHKIQMNAPTLYSYNVTTTVIPFQFLIFFLQRQ